MISARNANPVPASRIETKRPVVSRGVTSPDFTVSQPMRDELWRNMQQHGITIDRPSYDQARPLVDRLLAYTVDRYVYGPDAEFQRRTADDPVIGAAQRLASGATNEPELIRRAEQKK